MALRFENNGEKQRSPAKRKKLTRNFSFYAAVALCVGAVALTAATKTADSRKEHSGTVSEVFSEPVSQYTQPAEELLTGEWNVSDLALSSSDVQYVPSAVTTTTASAQTQPLSSAPVTAATTAVAVPASADLVFRMPTDGSVTGGFSGDELVFCSTMCDWRVHNGMDISGEYGGEVRACADGMVEGVVEDMLYGTTVIIRHADDSVLYYCGLNDTKMVSTGLQVNAGDVIGYIGEVPCELADGAHIHLSLMKDGSFIDPAEYIGGR